MGNGTEWKNDPEREGKWERRGTPASPGRQGENGNSTPFLPLLLTVRESRRIETAKVSLTGGMREDVTAFSAALSELFSAHHGEVRTALAPCLWLRVLFYPRQQQDSHVH